MLVFSCGPCDSFAAAEMTTLDRRDGESFLAGWAAAMGWRKNSRFAGRRFAIIRVASEGCLKYQH